MGNSRKMRATSLAVASALIFTSTAAVAATSNAPIVAQSSPWVSLSMMSGAAPAAALCGSSAAIAAAAGQAAQPGCVLPQVDAAPAAVAEAGPPAPVPVPPVEPIGGGFYLDPLLLGLAAVAIGALIYFVLIKKDGGSPNSPA